MMTGGSRIEMRRSKRQEETKIWKEKGRSKRSAVAYWSNRNLVGNNEAAFLKLTQLSIDTLVQG